MIDFKFLLYFLFPIKHTHTHARTHARIYIYICIYYFLVFAYRAITMQNNYSGLINYEV